MSLSSFKLSKYFCSIFAAVALSFTLVLPVQAAQFIETDNAGNAIVNKQDQENVYAAGSTVEISARILSDAVVVGQKINFANNIDVTGGILAAGDELNLTPRTVGGSVRAIGGNITVSGFVRKDVVVAGQTVTLRNIKIGGDLIINAQKVIVGEDVAIQGKIYVSAPDIEGNLTNVSGKDIVIQKEGNYNFSPFSTTPNWAVVIYTTLSTALVLAFLTFILFRKNKLRVSSIAFNTLFGKDLFLGTAVFFLTLPLVLISFIITIGYTLFPLIFVIYGLWALSGVYSSIYIANFIQNTLKFSIDIRYTIVAIFVVSTVLLILPFVGILWGVVLFILSLAQFGFILNGLKTAIFAKSQ